MKMVDGLHTKVFGSVVLVQGNNRPYSFDFYVGTRSCEI